MEKKNALPRPSTLSAHIFPWCASTICFAMDNPSYPRGMEILLLFMVLGLLVVITVDAKQKRVAFLCQQVETKKRS